MSVKKHQEQKVIDDRLIFCPYNTFYLVPLDVVVFNLCILKAPACVLTQEKVDNRFAHKELEV